MKIKVIFGLGNPGSKYENTYHNVGSLYVRGLRENDCEVVDMANEELAPVFMNESGIAIKKYLKKKGLKPKEILVVHDDSDIALGKYKYAYGSRSAGHKGVQSIIDALRTNDFHRIKIGVRTKPGKALDFVLRKISKKDKEALDRVFEKINPAIRTILF